MIRRQYMIGDKIRFKPSFTHATNNEMMTVYTVTGYDEKDEHILFVEPWFEDNSFKVSQEIMELVIIKKERYR